MAEGHVVVTLSQDAAHQLGVLLVAEVLRGDLGLGPELAGLAERLDPHGALAAL